MPSYKSVFFVKEGPKKVDFDIEKVFLEGITPSSKTFNADDLKDFIDSRLIKLEETSKERHGELLEYIEELEGRISRVEEQGFQQNEIGINSGELDDLLNLNNTDSTQSLLNSDIRKSSEVPNVSLNQEELDVLLSDIDNVVNNPEDNSDNENTYVEHKTSENLDNTDPSLEVNLDEINENELKPSDIDLEEFSYPNEDIMQLSENFIDSNLDSDDIVDEEIRLENFSSLSNDLKLETENDFEDVNENEIQTLSSNLHEIKEDLSEDFSNIFTKKTEDKAEELLELNDNNDMDSDSINEFSLDEVNSNLDSLMSDLNPKSELDTIGNDLTLKFEDLFTAENIDTSFDDNSIAAPETPEAEINNDADIDFKLDELLGEVNDLDSVVNNEVSEEDESTIHISTNAEGKDFDDFENVLKQDLNYSNMNDSLENFNHKNLYDDDIKQLEDKINDGEEVELQPLVGTFENDDETKDIVTSDSLELDTSDDDFKPSDLEAILNRFEDLDYLSKINLSSEERMVLVKFIRKIENELSSNDDAQTFKTKPEYEILNKIKYFLMKK